MAASLVVLVHCTAGPEPEKCRRPRSHCSRQSGPAQASRAARDPAGSRAPPASQPSLALFGLEKLVELSARCQGIQFRIVGHRGHPQSNSRLGRDRHDPATVPSFRRTRDAAAQSRSVWCDRPTPRAQGSRDSLRPAALLIPLAVAMQLWLLSGNRRSTVWWGLPSGFVSG